MADLQPLLTDLHSAQVALRQSSDVFQTAAAGLRQAAEGFTAALDAITAAQTKQGLAMDAVIRATEQALRLVNGHQH